MQARKVTDAVAQFIVSDIRPVNVVDGLGFLNLMEVAQPPYLVPCCRTIMEVIKSKYTSTKRNVHGLSLQTSVEHILKQYPELRSYFLSQDQYKSDQCLSCLQALFHDPMSEAYLLF